MLTYPNLDPIALRLGTISVHWYGICYLIGMLGCYWLCVVRGKGTKWNQSKILDVLFYAALGIIFGGRVGYVLFYYPAEIFNDPLTLLAFWEPGRSFHGGMIGVIIALYIYVKFDWNKLLELTDFIAPSIPIGLGFGRLGNFINGELYGRVTNMPWGMVFPHAGAAPRHASQLYEMIFEGLFLCLFLLWYARKPHKLGAVSGMFLVGYGVVRSLIELVREPDIDQDFYWTYLPKDNY
nr:Prolipoprotein diacylglyceryl transferase [uncultured bacterium]